MQFKVHQEKDGTVDIQVTTDTADGQRAKQKALEGFAPQVSITGFRPGKAPLNMVEPQIKTGKLAEEIVSILAGMAYTKAVADHKLQPISQPSVNIPEIAEKENSTAVIWPKVIEQGLDFEITTYVKPEIKLGDWKKVIRKIKPASAGRPALTRGRPDNADKSTPADKPEAKPNDDQIIQALVEAIEFDIPGVLVKREAEHSLIHHLQAVQKLGISFEDYLKTQKKKPAAFQKELEQKAEKSLRGNLILSEIALELKMDENATFKDVLEHLKKLTSV